VKWHEQKQRFQCPCHGSEFDRTGNVMHGPATRPLSHLFISKESNRTVRLLEKPPEGSQKVP
jgi:cytochrome b6-f complex iron-sulfur subunit